ncbi:MAG: hypothetical protein J0L82_00810 [Deltaproteobacteria bacterium]|nr:hypothetical protein [Deltaproteobacteria bacterium]
MFNNFGVTEDVGFDCGRGSFTAESAVDISTVDCCYRHWMKLSSKKKTDLARA